MKVNVYIWKNPCPNLPFYLFFGLHYSCKNDISHNYIIQACFILKKKQF